MKKVLFSNWLILIALLIFSCSTSEKNLIKEGHQALKHDEIRHLLSGNTLTLIRNDPDILI